MVLSQIINQLANPTGGLPGGFGGRRRHLFIPPSTNTPLFLYGEGEDRSFISLPETENHSDSDAASVSTSRSLPSTLSSAQASDQESFHSWLQDESERRRTSGFYDNEDRYEDGSALHDEIDSTDGNARTGRKHRNVRRGSSLSSLLAPMIDPYSELEDYVNLQTTHMIELKMLIRYSIPLIIAFLLEHFFSLVCMLVVGHLGKKELAAVSLASMSSTITLGIFDGISTALDTLCPQAYGAENYELVSSHVQRCTMFSLVAYIPFGFVWWFSGNILQFVIEDDEVLYLTQLFLRILILGAPAYIFFACSQRFLQAQGIFEASTGVLFVAAPINIFLSWFLVWNETYGMGYIGAPIATVINFWLMSIFLVLYVVYIDGNKCWFGLISWSKMFQQWSELLHLAIPGVIMIESESLAYEILTLFATYFGTSALAAQSAVLSIAALAYMVPFAVGTASLTRIANFIGGQNQYSAKIATQTGLMCSFIVASLNGIFLYAFKNKIATMFTTAPDVVEMIVELIDPLVAIIQLFDGVAAVASGILRAMGLQKIGGLINFLCYYAVGIPISLVLSRYYDFGLEGLWIGIGVGMILIGGTEIAVILLANWDDILTKAGIMNGLYDEVDVFESDDE